MSETARSYSGFKGGRGTGFRTRSRRRWRVIPWMLVLVVILLIAAYWISRDTRSTRLFIDRNAALLCTAPDYLGSRERVANSPLWGAFADDDPWSDLPEVLLDRVGLPAWVYRNFAPGALHVWANDTEEYSDAVIVSRMSRVGTVVERIHRFLPGKRADWAGGLRIYYRPSLEWYYAVRGRVLVAARSRKALVRALTLSAEEHWTPADLKRAVASGAEDLRGVIQSASENAAWSQIRFAVRIESDEVLARFETELSDAGRERWAPLLAVSPPDRLTISADAPASLAFQRDMPLAEVWAAIGAGTEWPFFSTLQWRKWNRGERGPTAAWLTSLAEYTGSMFTASWHGFDVDARYPVPLVSGAAVAQDAKPVEELFTRLGTEAYEPDGWEPLPYRVDDAAFVPLPDFQDAPLILERDGQEVRFRVASPVPFDAPTDTGGAPWQSEGHLIFRFSPPACVQHIDTAGQFLADYGLISKHDRESFHRLRRERERRMAHIRNVGVSVTVGTNGFSLSLNADLES